MKRIPPYDHPSYTPDHLVTYAPLFNRPKRKKKKKKLGPFIILKNASFKDGIILRAP